MNGEEFRYRGTVFLIECKEHINRVAGPGSRNYIVRDLISYGEEVIFPESIEGDPVTSFLPFPSLREKCVYPGVRKIRLPEWLGRFIERNDVFPDLDSIEIDPGNRIFTTDGKMLYRDDGKELCLSLSLGLREETVTVPSNVERLGPSAFTGSKCREILFENPGIEAADTSFDGSEWLAYESPAVYAGDMLYRVTATGRERVTISIKKGTERVYKNAFSHLSDGTAVRLCIRDGMKLPGLTDAIMEALKKRRSGIITVSGENGRRELPIPLSIDLSGMELLRKTIDLGEALCDEVFLKISSSREKLDYALFRLSEEENVNEDLYRQTVKRDEEAAAGRSALILGEERLCRLIKREYIGKEAFYRIIPKLQAKGMVSAVASILKNRR